MSTSALDSPRAPEVPWSACEQLADPARSTFVLHEVRTGQTRVCNADRAAMRFVPASTFKIPHALVALESGVVRDENSRFSWNGRPLGVAAWERDTSLADAIRESTVWVFQDVATRLGYEQEAAALERLGYGNRDVGAAKDLRRFWLSGPLEISALEQVRFLARLRQLDLDVDPDSQRRVIAMLQVGDCGSGCTIYGKTGAVLPINDDGALHPGDMSLLPPAAERTGWFVGWVERPDTEGGPLVFAHNLDLTLPGAMTARTAIVYRILDWEGVQAAPSR